ncbi:MAG: hypothetical protein JWR05_2976 [Mucilaginibacter sp.]|nr:hypothetical protein [Mucilaginibacter sp.]
MLFAGSITKYNTRNTTLIRFNNPPLNNIANSRYCCWLLKKLFSNPAPGLLTINNNITIAGNQHR